MAKVTIEGDLEPFFEYFSECLDKNLHTRYMEALLDVMVLSREDEDKARATRPTLCSLLEFLASRSYITDNLIPLFAAAQTADFGTGHATTTSTLVYAFLSHSTSKVTDKDIENLTIQADSKTTGMSVTQFEGMIFSISSSVPEEQYPLMEGIIDFIPAEYRRTNVGNEARIRISKGDINGALSILFQAGLVMPGKMEPLVRISKGIENLRMSIKKHVDELKI
jgi:hypothetical protein